MTGDLEGLSNSKPDSGALELAPWGIGSVILAIVLALCLFLSALLTTAIIARFFHVRLHSTSGDVAGLAATIAFDLCLYVVTLALALTHRGMSLQKFGLRTFPLRDVYVPAAGIVAMYIILGFYVAAVTQLHLPRFRPLPNLPEHLLQTKGLILPTAIAACVVAPIVEETFFRGFVFRGIVSQTIAFGLPGHVRRLRLGFWPAALVSGLLFASVHFELGLLVPFTAIGVLFAWMFWRSGSLWPNILAHAGFNAISLTLALATQR
ncbi:MAG TPA: CPBP family intramembrane glutamic endopeptidase [Dehalococcoidia bacterium]|nr:CPBP family intramembrane glutamic endopeptidase [Dehalococcoidia bacterium]